MKSAPLIKLDRDTSVVIDELIDKFLEKHVPSEISQWDEEVSNIWTSLVPLVHLAFAGGKEHCRENQRDDIDHGNYLSILIMLVAAFCKIKKRVFLKPTNQQAL